MGYSWPVLISLLYIWDSMLPHFNRSSNKTSYIPENKFCQNKTSTFALQTDKTKFTDQLTKENFQIKDGSCDHPGDI